MTILEFILAAGGSGTLAVLGTIGVNIYRARSANKNDEKKVESEVHVTEVDKAAELSREVAQDLRNDLAEIKVDLKVIQEAHLACREENAGLKAENKGLREEVLALRGEVKTLTDKVNELLARK